MGASAPRRGWNIIVSALYRCLCNFQDLFLSDCGSAMQALRSQYLKILSMGKPFNIRMGASAPKRGWKAIESARCFSMSPEYPASAARRISGDAFARLIVISNHLFHTNLLIFFQISQRAFPKLARLCIWGRELRQTKSIPRCPCHAWWYPQSQFLPRGISGSASAISGKFCTSAYLSKIGFASISHDHPWGYVYHCSNIANYKVFLVMGWKFHLAQCKPTPCVTHA